MQSRMSIVLWRETNPTRKSTRSKWEDDNFVNSLIITTVSCPVHGRTQTVKSAFLTLFFSEPLQPRGDKFAFRIITRHQGPPFDVLVDTEDEMKDWLEKITESSSMAIQRVTQLL